MLHILRLSLIENSHSTIGNVLGNSFSLIFILFISYALYKTHKNTFKPEVGHSNSEREVTIQGTHVILHECEYSNAKIFDYSNQVSVIQSTFQKQLINKDAQLILVIGISGSGKSLLAKVIENALENTKYIDCLSAEFDNKEQDYSNFLPDKEKLYIIDSPEFISSSIWKAVDNHVQDGKCICFIQDIREYQGQSNTSNFRLTKSEFKAY